MTVDATTPAFARPRLDVGLTFKGGWNAFAADIVALIVGALIACILSVVTIGILAGPLTAGLYSMVVGRIRDGRPAHIGDVFSCMDRFWGFLWAAIVLVVLIALASLTIVGGVLLATVWLYVFPFMVDRKMGLTDAMAASYHQVVDNGFWEHLVLLVIVFAIGAVANGWVGLLATPFTHRPDRRRLLRLRRPRGPDRAPAGAAGAARPDVAGHSDGARGSDHGGRSGHGRGSCHGRHPPGRGSDGNGLIHSRTGRARRRRMRLRRARPRTTYLPGECTQPLSLSTAQTAME